MAADGSKARRRAERAKKTQGPAGADHAKKAERDRLRLVLVPIGVAVVFGSLLLPRRAFPDGVPLPVPDRAALARSAAADHDLVERAHRTALTGAVRALGSAIRDFHVLEARQAAPRELGEPRRRVDEALVGALAGPEAELLELRAVQLEGFLDEVRRFQATGDESPELAALAGGFVRAMRGEGWIVGRRVVPGEAALRAMFKQMWNGFLGLDGRPAFALPLDEARALYAVFLSRPHAALPMRDALAAARRGARDAKSCAAVAQAERAATEAWRLERITRLASIDPSYPAAFARGVALLRRGEPGAAAESFRRWLQDHPDGPLTLRAQNYLRAAIDADRIE